jgi:hypothetical protein
MMLVAGNQENRVVDIAGVVSVAGDLTAIIDANHQ